MAARKTPSKGSKPDKLMREALSVELHQDVDVRTPEQRSKKGSRPVLFKKYRLVQRALVNAGIKGDVSAIKEINDRMDGKVVQKVGGDADAPPIKHEHSGGVRVKHDYSGLSDDELSRLHATKVGAARSD